MRGKKLTLGGCKRCAKCDIYLCLMFKITLNNFSEAFPAKCPMCGGEMTW